MARAVARLTLIASVFLLSACALFPEFERREALPRMMASPNLVMPAAPAPMVIGRAAPRFASDPQDYVCYEGATLRVMPTENAAIVNVSVNGAAPVALMRSTENGSTAYRANGMKLRRANGRAVLSGATNVVVQPGDTLGLIARRVYGDRLRATEIAAANADTIANPNLIYPGQELRLPATERRCRRRFGDQLAVTPISAPGG